MDKLNVYLSSPYFEFRDKRQKFLTEIQARSYLYEITAMEDYAAEDRNVLYKCIEDVEKCNIYVCIIGEGYGSIAKDKNGVETGKSFTYWEYATACKRKERGDDIERLVLIKNVENPNDLPPLLQQWKQEIGSSQIQTIFYNHEDDISQKIIFSLDNYVKKRLDALVSKKDVPEQKIFLCDRTEQNQEFLTSLDDESALQFFLLNCHDKDLAHYFIRRKQIEFEDAEQEWVDIDIRPVIPNDITDFDKVDNYVKAEILTKLKWKKFKLPKDVTIEGLIDYMDANNIDYLSISWFIESTYWKNEKLNDFVGWFYEKYNQLNQQITTTRHILFFGILRYIENPDFPQDQFNDKISKIIWKNNLPKFKKLNRQDIKDWLCDYEIEEMSSRADELISVYIKDLMEKDLYFSEVESGLREIIKLYNVEHFK
ncbi:MAG: hypothetical protein JWQ09_4554 [Segetibacter sp.]|nr:hypothetical protein [Segetibacter sp.]